MKKDDNKKTFKELWANPRYKALIKLGMWAAFFILMFLISFVVSLFNKTTNYQKKDNSAIKEEKVETNISILLRNLKTSDYSYEYRITNAEVTYSYNGTKDNNTDKGYYENGNDIIKYEIKEGLYYRVENNETIEDNNIMNETDRNIIDINNLIKKIYDFEDENKNPEIHEDIYTYDFSNETEKYVVNITKTANSVSKIEINFNDIKYILEYKSIVE